MKNSPFIKIKKIQPSFLNPRESNIDTLLLEISRLINGIKKKSLLGTPRIGGLPNFNYQNELKKHCMGENIRSSREVLNEMSNIFYGTLRWHDTNVCHNVTPAPLFESVASSVAAKLYNGNALMDYTSGNGLLYEKIIIKFLAEMVGYKSAFDGLSTFGGKATLLYAVKAGLNRVNRLESVVYGIKSDYVVLASTAAHYTLESVCSLLGIGNNNLIRIPCNSDEEIIIEKFQETYEKLLVSKKKIACIIASGSGTIDHNIDSLRGMENVILSINKKYKVDYQPYIHFDTVNGWIWFPFINYDFNANPENIEIELLKKIKKHVNRIKDVKIADSFSADFHKTGLCPYVSTFIIFKDKKDFQSLNSSVLLEKDLGNYGDLHIRRQTIEHSRSLDGIVSAYAVLMRLGMRGLRTYLEYFLFCQKRFRFFIENKYSDEFQIINKRYNWFGTLIMPIMKGHNYSFDKLLENENLRKIYQDYCIQFYNYLCYNNCNKKAPLFGFLAAHWKLKDRPRSLFLFYGMSMYYNEKNIKKLVEDLIEQKIHFEKNVYCQNNRKNIINNPAFMPR